MATKEYHQKFLPIQVSIKLTVFSFFTPLVAFINIHPPPLHQHDQWSGWGWTNKCNNFYIFNITWDRLIISLQTHIPNGEDIEQKNIIHTQYFYMLLHTHSSCHFITSFYLLANSQKVALKSQNVSALKVGTTREPSFWGQFILLTSQETKAHTWLNMIYLLILPYGSTLPTVTKHMWPSKIQSSR
jgi:hypothetical protein